MTSEDKYILGRSDAEERRLARQMAMLAPESEWMFDRIGIAAGERVLDLGCGPGGVLDLLASRVGPSGSVLGIERSPHYVELARRFVRSLGLHQVEVREGDAYATGLPVSSFDGAHMRLVLVNVPRPEEMARELVRLVRPGGWVASLEADYLTVTCDPPHPTWTRLMDAFRAYAETQSVDLHVGRRTHRLLREAGLADIEVATSVSALPVGNPRRWVMRDFVVNVREGIVSSGIMGEAALADDLAAMSDHLNDPQVMVYSHLFVRAWGRVPA